MAKKGHQVKKQDLDSGLAKIRSMKADRKALDAGTERYKCLNIYCGKTIRLSKREAEPECWCCGFKAVKLPSADLHLVKGEDE